MTSLQKEYTYKKNLKITAYAASVVAFFVIFSRIITNIKGDTDFFAILVFVLFLILPLGAIVTVNTRYVIANEMLAKRFPIGEQSIRWTDVTEVMEKEGFFQQVLILIDKNGRRMTLPCEQLDGGKELCAKVREMVPKTH